MRRLLLFLIILLPLVFSHCWTEKYNCRPVTSCHNVYVGKECHTKEKCVGGWVTYCKRHGCIKYHYYTCCEIRYEKRCWWDTCRRSYTCCKDWDYECVCHGIEIFGFCLGWKDCDWVCKKYGTCYEYYSCRKCRMEPVRNCRTCKYCEEYGCVEYGRKWDPCARKEKYEVCEDKYKKVCNTYTVCDERLVCDEKPEIVLDLKEIKPGDCFKIKVRNLEKPYKMKMEVYLDNLELFSGIVNSNEKTICVNDIYSLGEKELKVKVWDLSDDPSYDFDEKKIKVKAYSKPIIYEVKICVRNKCGLFFEVPNETFILKFKTKYARKVFVEFGGKRFEVNGNEVKLYGSGPLKIIAENEYGRTEFVYGNIEIIKFSTYPFVPIEGKRREIAFKSVLTASLALLAVYLNDYVRKVVLSVVGKVGKDFWRKDLIRIKGENVELTDVGIKYVEEVKKKLSIREIFEKFGRSIAELFNSFRTKIFYKKFEFKYKELYAKFGKEFVDEMIERYGNRAVEVLRKVEDREFAEFVLKNKLEKYDLKVLRQIYKIVPKKYYNIAIRIYKATGRKDFIRFLVRFDLIDKFKSFNEKEILNALSLYDAGLLLTSYSKFGIEGLRKAVVDRKVEKYSRIRKRLLRAIEKIYEDWDKTVYLVEEGNSRSIIEIPKLDAIEKRIEILRESKEDSRDSLLRKCVNLIKIKKIIEKNYSWLLYLDSISNLDYETFKMNYLNKKWTAIPDFSLKLIYDQLIKEYKNREQKIKKIKALLEKINSEIKRIDRKYRELELVEKGVPRWLARILPLLDDISIGVGLASIKIPILEPVDLILDTFLSSIYAYLEIRDKNYEKAALYVGLAITPFISSALIRKASKFVDDISEFVKRVRKYRKWTEIAQNLDEIFPITGKLTKEKMEILDYIVNNVDNPVKFIKKFKGWDEIEEIVEVARKYDIRNIELLFREGIENAAEVALVDKGIKREFIKKLRNKGFDIEELALALKELRDVKGYQRVLRGIVQGDFGASFETVIAYRLQQRGYTVLEMRKTIIIPGRGKTEIDIELGDMIVECKAERYWTRSKIAHFINQIKLQKEYSKQTGKTLIVYFLEEPPEEIRRILIRENVPYKVLKLKV